MVFASITQPLMLLLVYMTKSLPPLTIRNAQLVFLQTCPRPLSPLIVTF